MRPGEVVSIRVNPTDCMAVADLLMKVGAFQPGMSFSSAVSIALSSALESMRVAGLIPERTGFEYQEIMQPFVFKTRDGKKLAITNMRHMMGSDGYTPALALPSKREDAPISHGQGDFKVNRPDEPLPSMGAPTAVGNEADVVIRLALRALVDKKEAWDAKLPGATWTSMEQLEYDRLVALVYG